LKKNIKNFAIAILEKARMCPTYATDVSEILSLLEKLYPVSVDKGLIRMGPSGDGGYLVPDDLSGIEACFSPGVDTISGFEKECAERGMKVFMADKSVDSPAEPDARFNFIKKYIGAVTNDDYITMDGWVESSLPGSQSDLLLQIDIEGYEYEAFLSMSNKLMERFRIIVCEFHNLDMLWSEPFFPLASHTFEKILQTHTCVHIHPNNSSPAVVKNGIEIPPAMEFTFLRAEREGSRALATDFPHPLDGDNLNSYSPLPLPECWHG